LASIPKMARTESADDVLAFFAVKKP
jgi:hypothetical protein